ncbi:hypothetical protein A5906_08370 [Bradyrhizobium sacchari]|nr:hypothetical protein A5906_08370 [Bradyrhizobium sacchari]
MKQANRAPTRFQVASTVRPVAFRRRVFEPGKSLLDRIEVETIGRQAEQLCASGGANGAPDGLSFVTAGVADDDNVAGLERWHQHLLDLGQEAFAVDRSVDHALSVDPVVAQRSKEGQRPPAAMWSLRRAARYPSAARVQVMFVLAQVSSIKTWGGSSVSLRWRLPCSVDKLPQGGLTLAKAGEGMGRRTPAQLEYD